MRRATVLAILGLILVAGCLSSVGGDKYAEDYLNKLNRTAIDHPDYIDECKMGSCWCMVCKNGTNIFGSMTSLVGGHCYFQTYCNQTKAKEIMSNKDEPDKFIQGFMLGQGPTFGDFSAANPYCNSKLGMAVQWLTATNETPYTLPGSSRAICFLSKGVVPVYVLYSKGEDIDIGRTKQIAEILGTEGDDFLSGRLSPGPIGPVIVTTEIDFNASDADLIAEQVRAINAGCGNVRDPTNISNNEIHCFVAVAPKIHDDEALDAVMENLNLSGETHLVDLVAYGINGKYVHTCSGVDIKQQALNFSMYSLYKWGKPTVIPYVLFDAQGKDVDGEECWNERTMLGAYSSFWPGGIIALQQVGVLGIAPYSFNSTTYGVSNPLECVDCGIGKDNQRLESWYSWCQSYTGMAVKTATGTSTQPLPTTPIMFPNESGGYCPNDADLTYMLRGMTFGDAASNRNILDPRQPDLNPPKELYFTCDECIVSNATRAPPFAFSKAGNIPEEACTIYPEINLWAGQRNVDPMLMRAFIYVESRFNKCAAAKVCSKEYKQTLSEAERAEQCFQTRTDVDDECYYKAYDEMYDPDKECDQYLPPAPNYESANPDWRWCALGMVQTIEPPWTFWPAEYHPDEIDGKYFDIYAESGFYARKEANIKFAKSCAADGKYNPFNVSHSVCMGTAKLADALDKARAWIANNHNLLNWQGSKEGDYEKDSIFAAYVAGHVYSGFWYSDTRIDHPIERGCSGMANGDCWAKGFHESWNKNASTCVADQHGNLPNHCSAVGVPIKNPPYQCYGYTDFVEYFRDCEMPFLQRQADPGDSRMAVYYWLKNTTNCRNSFCPEGEVLGRKLCELDETGSYNPEFCTASGLPKFLDPTTGSGTPYIK